MEIDIRQPEGPVGVVWDPGDRRLFALCDLNSRAMEAKSAEEAYALLAGALARHAEDIPFALIYAVDVGARAARLCGVSGAKLDEWPHLTNVQFSETAAPSDAWPLFETARDVGLRVVDDLPSRFKGSVPPGPWSDPPRQAVIVPICTHVTHRVTGFLVAGVSSRLALDVAYKRFLELVASQIGTAIANGLAYAEEEEDEEALAELEQSETSTLAGTSHEPRSPRHASQVELLLHQRQQLLDSERAARTEAERLGRIKDEFLATLSHELRTPLNSILGWAQLIRSDLGSGELLEKGLEVIERSALAQAQLISDLLDMNRIASGKLELEFEEVNLEKVIEIALEALRPTFEAKRVKMDLVLGPLRAPVRGDSERLQQVVWNLISNAIKFSDVEGVVRVELRDLFGSAEIIVSDNGKGIKREFLPYLFERFRQQDATTSRKYGGLGLGLSIVRQLVDLHGGAVTAESEGEGTGSAFKVALPYAREASTTGSETARREGHSLLRSDIPTLAGVKVLVVDDDEDARDLLKRLLESSSAEVLVCGSAVEALEILGRERPQVLVSDISMPGRDGYQLIRDVRRSGSDVPAAALTAFARPGDRTRALLSGYQSHITKPIDGTELLVTVASLAGKLSGS